MISSLLSIKDYESYEAVDGKRFFKSLIKPVFFLAVGAALWMSAVLIPGEYYRETDIRFIIRPLGICLSIYGAYGLIRKIIIRILVLCGKVQVPSKEVIVPFKVSEKFYHRVLENDSESRDFRISFYMQIGLGFALIFVVILYILLFNIDSEQPHASYIVVGCSVGIGLVYNGTDLLVKSKKLLRYRKKRMIKKQVKTDKGIIWVGKNDDKETESWYTRFTKKTGPLSGKIFFLVIGCLFFYNSFTSPSHGYITALLGIGCFFMIGYLFNINIKDHEKKHKNKSRKGKKDGNER